MIDKKLISQIHAKFRQLKSGEVADNLKAQGVTYRLAWGVQSYRMREIAAAFKPDAEVAEYLWNEDVRESKLLAPRLYPIDKMTSTDAERWAKNIQHIEVADQVAMHLFSKLPFATTLAETWISEEQDDMHRYLALMIASRLDDIPQKVKQEAQQMVSGNHPLWIRAAAVRITEND